MIYSMTGYAAVTQEISSGSLSIELRTVNGRYLDIQFNTPEEFRAAEPAMREILTAQLSRGKISCRLNFSNHSNPEHAPQINVHLFKKLIELNQTIKSSLPEAQSLSVADILGWPGILSNDSLATKGLHKNSIALLQEALNDLLSARAREGEKLKIVLLERLHQIRALVVTALPYIPALLVTFEEKLKTRLKEAAVNLEDDRIRQEISLFAGKIDIDEELSRLQTHLDEVERILSKGGVVGKRLDFMMQELNREANTIGSKSVNIKISEISIALKVLIEQMREQVQNIE